MELAPESFQEELRKKRFRPAYYLFGEDSEAKLAALEALKTAVAAGDFDLTEFSGESDAQALEVVAACSTPPMLSQRRLVTVRGARFGAAGRRALADYLRDPLKSTTLAVLSPAARIEGDDVLANAARALGAAVDFRPLSEGEAAARLLREAKASGLELEPAAAQRMVEEAGTVWGVLKTELEKVRLFCAGRKRATLADALACLGYRKELKPWELTDALEARDGIRTLKLLRRLLEDGEDPFSLLYRVTTSLNQTLQAQRLARSGASPEQAAGMLRMPPSMAWKVSKLMAKSREADEAGLVQGLKACLRVETALKSQAWLDPAIELETLVAGLCRGKKRL